jgi:hypothetical protein
MGVLLDVIVYSHTNIPLPPQTPRKKKRKERYNRHLILDWHNIGKNN